MHLKSLRQEGDALADRAFAYLRDHPDEFQKITQLGSNDELQQHDWAVNVIDELISDVYSGLPENHLQVSEFFQRYSSEIFLVLGLFALPYCYAGANGVRVLALSRKIKENPEKRLRDTAQFVFEVLREGAFEPHGRGFPAILEVRLFHAAARYHSRRYIRDEVPVNQMDMLGTLLAFSLITIRGLRKVGIDINPVDVNNFLEYWNFIGQRLGICKEYLPANIRQASQLDRSIRKSEFKRSEEGVMLTGVLVDYLRSQKHQFDGLDPADLMYFLLGPEVSGVLSLNPSSRMVSQLIGEGFKLRNQLQWMNPEAAIQKNLAIQSEFVRGT